MQSISAISERAPSPIVPAALSRAVDAAARPPTPHPPLPAGAAASRRYPLGPRSGSNGSNGSVRSAIVSKPRDVPRSEPGESPATVRHP